MFMMAKVVARRAQHLLHRKLFLLYPFKHVLTEKTIHTHTPCIHRSFLQHTGIAYREFMVVKAVRFCPLSEHYWLLPVQMLNCIFN